MIAIICLLKRIMAIITLHTLHNKQVAYLACGARRDVLYLACCTQHLWHSMYDFFLCQNSWDK